MIRFMKKIQWFPRNVKYTTFFQIKGIEPLALDDKQVFSKVPVHNKTQGMDGKHVLYIIYITLSQVHI
jgi:hypothetical protein